MRRRAPVRHAGVGVVGSPMITSASGPDGARRDVTQVPGEAVLEHDDAGLGIVELVLQERAAQAGIDRNPDGAELRRGEEHADRLGAVADQAQDAIARAASRARPATRPAHRSRRRARGN